MGRRKPYEDQELTFAPKISKTSKRIAQRLTEQSESKAKSKGGIPRFMRETKSKKLHFTPLAHVHASAAASKESPAAPRIVDGNDLFDPEPALTSSHPLRPNLSLQQSSNNGSATEKMSGAGGKLAASGSAAAAEDGGGKSHADPFSGLVRSKKNGYMPPRALQLDESVFTFKPKVSSASAKIAESLGTDFMSRQQMHLEKQRRLLEQSSQLRFPTHLAPRNRRHEGRESEDVNNNSSQLDSRGTPADDGGGLTFASDAMGDPASSVGGKMCAESNGSPSSGLQRLLTGPYAASVGQLVFKRKKEPRAWFAESADAAVPNRKLAPLVGAKRGDGELGDSLLSRSKTMPSMGKPKLNRKLSSNFNDGERLRMAKDMVEKAIKYRKVFTIQGGYSNIRHSLRRRGWVEKFYKIPTPAKKTPRTKQKKTASDDDDDDVDDDDDDDDDGADTVADGHDEPKIAPWEEDDGVYGIMSRMLRNTNPSLFWVLKRDVIDYRFINRDQMVNHYCKAGSFTTKVGLCVNMKNVPWFENADPDAFFPRCYRLSNDEEKQSFIDDFRLTACMNILKVAAQQNTMDSSTSSPDNAEDLPSSSSSPSTSADDDSNKDSGTKDTANAKPAACSNTDCKAKEAAGKCSCAHKDGKPATAGAAGKCSCAHKDGKPATAGAAGSDGKSATTATAKSGEEDAEGQSKSDPRLAKPGEKRRKKRVLVPLRILKIAMLQCDRFLSEREHEDIDKQEEQTTLTDGQWEDFITWYYHLVHEDGVIVSLSPSVVSLVESVINRLKTHCPQFDMDGTLNVWIVKPGAKSRGRGIMCYDRLDEMLKLVSAQVVKKDGKYVVQKYMERPLLIYNTKFDIRQWFLVTDWNPLTLWFYQDSYLRFCSQQYTLEDFDQAIHLSNNAIQKMYKNGPRSSKLPQENMWTHEEFKDYLKSRRHPNAWEEIIYPAMKHAIICALLCTQDIVEYRKSSFELYGADFMLTEDLQPWLIEINSSPSMDPSTAVTSRLCKNVLDDTIKVTVDRKYDKNCDVGAFELAFKQPVVTVPPYIGISLCVEGQAMRKPLSFPMKRYAEPSTLQVTDALFTHRPPLRQINNTGGEEGPKKTQSGPPGVTSVGAGNASQRHRNNSSPKNGSVSSCPPKTRGASDSSSVVVQIDGKTSNSAGHLSKAQAASSASEGGRWPERGERVSAELKVPSTQTLPPSRVVYTQHTPLPEAGGKRMVSRTSVSTNYMVPHPPSSSSASASASRGAVVVNNVESTDLKTFKPIKGRVRVKDSAWQRTCSACGAGMSLRLEVSNPFCRCQQDSLLVPLTHDALLFSHALPARPSPLLRPRSSSHAARSSSSSPSSSRPPPIPLYPSSPATGLPIQGVLSSPMTAGERVLIHGTEGGVPGPAPVPDPAPAPVSTRKARRYSPGWRKGKGGVRLSPRLSLALSMSVRTVMGSGMGGSSAGKRVYCDTSKVCNPLSILSRMPNSSSSSAARYS